MRAHLRLAQDLPVPRRERVLGHRRQARAAEALQLTAAQRRVLGALQVVGAGSACIDGAHQSYLRRLKHQHFEHTHGPVVTGNIASVLMHALMEKTTIHK